MKWIGMFLGMILFLFANTGTAQYEPNIEGYLRTDTRLRLSDRDFTWNENRLNVQISGGDLTSYGFSGEIRLRGFGFPGTSDIADLQRREKDKIQPWSLEFREAYLDLYGLGWNDLDVRLGRQIIQWGTGDGFNPTNNISPDDLEDFLFFGTHLGVNVLKATYYANPFRFTGIYVPIFTPAALPDGEFGNALFPQPILPPGAVVQSQDNEIHLPDRSVTASSQYAFKLSGFVYGFDVSVSYYHGRDDIPLLTNLSIVPETPEDFHLETAFSYPELQVYGGDFAGVIGPVGIWGEAALYLPEQTQLTSTFPSPQDPTQLIRQTTTALSEEPYIRYIIGGDYTFRNGWYLNMQFLHGFLHERGQGNLNDYLIFRMEKSLFHDRLSVTPIGLALTITDWNSPKENYGVIGLPELAYRPADNIELSLGGFLLDGLGANVFQSLAGHDELFLRAQVNF